MSGRDHGCREGKEVTQLTHECRFTWKWARTAWWRGSFASAREVLPNACEPSTRIFRSQGRVLLTDGPLHAASFRQPVTTRQNRYRALAAPGRSDAHCHGDVGEADRVLQRHVERARPIHSHQNMRHARSNSRQKKEVTAPALWTRGL
jgi:hypothetical protein